MSDPRDVEEGMPLTIDDVVHWEKTPESYTRIEPFSVTCHHTSLTIKEKQLIKDAIVNVGHEIRRRRGIHKPEPFEWRGADDS